MSETITFELQRDADGNKCLVGRQMPSEAVMSRSRFSQLWREYAQFLLYYTHTDNGKPRLTFLLSDAEYTYEVTTTDHRFMYLRRVQGEQ